MSEKDWDPEEQPARWSSMEPRQLLDMAQQALEEFEANPHADDRNLYRGYPIPAIRAQVLVAAAQVQATQGIDWTLEHRHGPMLAGGR